MLPEGSRKPFRMPRPADDARKAPSVISKLLESPKESRVSACESPRSSATRVGSPIADGSAAVGSPIAAGSTQGIVSPLKRLARVAEMQAQADLQEIECAAQRLQSRKEIAHLAKMCADTLQSRALSSKSGFSAKVGLRLTQELAAYSRTGCLAVHITWCDISCKSSSR